MTGPERPRRPTQEEIILSMLRDVLERQAHLEASPDDVEDVDDSVAPAKSLPAATPTLPPAAPHDAPKASPAGAVPADHVSGRPVPLLSPARALELQRFERRAAEDPGRDAGVGPLLKRLTAGLLLAAVLVNVPLARGLPLARALPDRQALIVRDGLVLKGSGPRIYVLEDNQRRWISSMDAFEHFGFVWEQVHVVDDEFLNTFPEGRPQHVLLKCGASPHIYRLEEDRKRWIRDIAAFEAEGHEWDDVQHVPCERLQEIPLGEPIPPAAGTPQPDASTGGG